MREIVLDTETTGLDPRSGDRIVELGCIELINHMPTDQVLHIYFNPERDMPEGAFNVHGLSEEFLRDFKLFSEHAEEIITFLGDDPLVIHNAAFDMKFLNAEFTRAGHPVLGMERAVDTLTIARKKYPGAQNSLDALCRRFGIDNSARTHHGALLDSELLAEVYLELVGGREPGLGLLSSQLDGTDASDDRSHKRQPARSEPLPSLLTPLEHKAHEEFVATLSDGALWLKVKP